jgi:DNA replication protein DnaC
VESLGDALRRLEILGAISRASTDISSSTDDAEVEAPPRCERCGDAGFLRRDVPVGHPDFGRAFPCACRTEVVQDVRRERLERLSHLGPLTRLTFDTLVKEGRGAEPSRRERFRRAYSAAVDYAAQPTGWLVLLGPSGCGKTHLAAAIANARIAGGEPVIFQVVPDLLDYLRATFHPASEVTYDESFEKVRNAPLLILDDLGTHSATPWAQEKLFQILNHRYNAQLPLVITTNHRLEDLDERLRARLSDPALAQVLVVEEWQSPILQRFGNSISAELLSRMTFESWDRHGMAVDAEGVQGLERALMLAQSFARNPDGWLVLIGPPGRGKTHLAAAINNACRASGREVELVVVPDLLDYLRATFGPDSRVTYDEAFETVRNMPILILDDLGAHSSTPWAQEKLYQLINHRYNARLPTVITTNIMLDDLDERLSSRMLDQRVSTCCPIIVPPYRMERDESSRPAPGRGARPRGSPPDRDRFSGGRGSLPRR